MRALLILSLFVLSSFVLAEGDISGARLLVYKDVDNPIAVVGQTLTFTTHFYNIGSSAASEVIFKDADFGDEFEILEGQLTAEWDTIAPGTNVSSKVVAKSVKSGYVRVGAGIVKYRSSNDETVHTALTSEIGTMLIETNMESRHRNGPQLFDFVLFVVFASVLVGAPFAIHQNKAKEFEAANKKK